MIEEDIVLAIMRVAYETFVDNLFDEFQITMDEEGIPEEVQGDLVSRGFGAALGQEYLDWLEG